jgi:putative flippase GtrA
MRVGGVVRGLTQPRLFGYHQLAAAFGTSVDFASMVALVELVGLAPPAATILSAIGGAATNFVLSRGWVFRRRHRGTLQAQVLRYGAASAGGAVLNALLLLFILRADASVPYALARLVVAMVVSVSYTYPTHALFVFRTTTSCPTGGCPAIREP